MNELIRMVINSSIAAARHGVPPAHRYDSQDYLSAMDFPMSDTLLVQHERGVATLCLNRPELHNAFDAGLIATLTAALERVGADPEVRAVVLTGSGASFSAGATCNGCAPWPAPARRKTGPTRWRWRA